jgi:hypothetical protein
LFVDAGFNATPGSKHSLDQPQRFLGPQSFCPGSADPISGIGRLPVPVPVERESLPF